VVVAADGTVGGIFTDGDLRRLLERGDAIRGRRVADVMTRSPRTIDRDALAIDCVARMETAPKVTQLLVTDARGALVGALHLHDLFRARVV
jgi:arabinose-5-phosphate isomerase